VLDLMLDLGLQWVFAEMPSRNTFLRLLATGHFTNVEISFVASNPITLAHDSLVIPSEKGFKGAMLTENVESSERFMLMPSLTSNKLKMGAWHNK
jgi:hypothetical protein